MVCQSSWSSKPVCSPIALGSHIYLQFSLKALVVSPQILNQAPYRNDVEKVTTSHTAYVLTKAIYTKHTIHMGSLFPPQGKTSSDTFVMCGCDMNANTNTLCKR